MNVVCVMVSSLNGKITNGQDPHIHSWTSKEDQQHFSHLIEQASCIIMGRKTYEQAKDMMQHRSGRLRIVLTTNPEQYKDTVIPEQLEFTSDQPEILLKRLADRGYKNILLVGGSSTNAAFLEKNLIDELLLTIEPVVFPTGTPLFEEGVEKKLILKSVETVNEKGTLLLTYMF